MRDIKDVLSNISGSNLEAAMRSLNKVMNTPEGQQIKSKLKNLDKKTLLEKLSKMDKNNIPGSNNISKAANDPDFIKKLNNFIDSQK